MNSIHSARIATPSFVERVEARLAMLLDDEGGLRAPAPLLAAARHLCLAGGKRLRPRLVEAFGEAVGAPHGSLVDVAVAAELMHAASLLHDDVVDDGSLRRGQPTVNARWGNTIAVLSGDLVLSAALVALRPREELRSPADDARLRLVGDAVDVVLSMTRGAMHEVAARARTDVSVEAWRAIAESKTGALFGFCGYAGAILAKDEDAAARHRRCGHHLGVAFQLADDLDDLAPLRAASTGKDPYADIRNGNPSFPLLLAAARVPAIRSALEAAWAGGVDKMLVLPEQARAIAEAVIASGAAAETLRAIDEELALAEGAVAGGTTRPALARIFEQARAQWRRAYKELDACAAM